MVMKMTWMMNFGGSWLGNHHLNGDFYHTRAEQDHHCMLLSMVFFSTRNGIYTPFTGRLVGKRMNWSLVYIWNRTSLVWWFLAEFRCHKLKRWQQLSHFCDFPRDLLDFGRLLYNICTVFQVYPSPLVVCSMIPSVSKMSVRGIFQTSPNPRTVSQ